MAFVPFDELGEAGRARRLRPLALAAMREWDLRVSRLRLLTNGYNAMFRVDTDDGPFVLRVNLPRRNDAELRAEIGWLTALARAGGVGVPIPTFAGEPWAVAAAPRVPGSRRCVLFSWIPGRDMTSGDDPRPFERFGAAAASLHEHAASWRRPRGLPTVRSPFPHADEPRILFDQTLAPGVRTIYERALEATENALARIADQRPMVVHHDLHPANVRIHRGRLWVVDFDDCLLATPAQDLGNAAFQMRMRGCGSAQLSAFRRGYASVRAWPEDDLVDAFTAGAALTLANGVFQDFDPGYRREADAYANRWAKIAAQALRASR